MEDAKQTLRIITHGNNGFNSSQLLDQLQLFQNTLETENLSIQFFPFTDLDVFNIISPIKPNPELENMNNQLEQGVEASAVLVLISQTEIFSNEMLFLIVDLHYNESYGYSENNEKNWWNHVVVVFSFGEYEGSDEKVQQSISGNRGIRDIVGKAGGRYVWMSNRTTPEEFSEKLHVMLRRIPNLYKNYLFQMVTCLAFILLLIAIIFYFVPLSIEIRLLILLLFIDCFLVWFLGIATIITIILILSMTFGILAALCYYCVVNMMKAPGIQWVVSYVNMDQNYLFLKVKCIALIQPLRAIYTPLRIIIMLMLFIASFIVWISASFIVSISDSFIVWISGTSYNDEEFGCKGEGCN